MKTPIPADTRNAVIASVLQWTLVHRPRLGHLIAVMILAASSTFGASVAWDANTGTTGAQDGPGTWDTSTANWWNVTNNIVWPNTTADTAIFGTNSGTAGTVTVSGSVTANIVLFNAPVSGSYTLSGGTINMGGSGTRYEIAASQTPVINSVIGEAAADTAVQFRGTGGGSGSITLGGANTFTGGANLRAVTVNFDSLANSGTASSFGSSGNVRVVVNSSFARAYYTGGEAATDRLFVVGGTGGGTINNNGSGAISFNNTGSAIDGTGNRSLTLGGSYTASANTFAEQLADASGVTTLTVRDNTWNIMGANTHGGGTTINGGTLILANDAALGSASAGLTFVNDGTLAATNNGATSQNDVTIGASRTITVSSGTASFKTPDINNLVIAAKITGAGNVRKDSSSYSLGTVRFSNDANDYLGDFTARFGNTEFTSVADGGSPSSLGAASSAYAIAASASATRFSYVGAGNTTTTRAIDWQGTTGGLTLQNNGSGSVQFLATADLRSGTDSASLTLSGSNTGDNTLAQPINEAGGGNTVSLTKSGTGKWILTGANAYTGDTTVNEGTLLVNGSLDSGSAVSVSGGTLGGTGTINGSVEVDGTLSPGASMGTLTMGTLTLNSGATTAMEIGNGPSGDKAAASGAVAYGGTLKLIWTGTTPATGTVDLFDGSGFSGAFSSLQVSNWPSAYRVNTNSLNSDGSITIAANASPAAQNLTMGVSQGDSATLLVIGGKQPPTDADGDAMAVSLPAGTTANGAAVATDGASVTVNYSAVPNYSGTDSFSYTVTDAFGASDAKTVTVMVAPAASGANITGLSVVGSTATITAQGIPGLNYKLQHTDNLSPVSWTDTGDTDTASGTGVITLIDSSAPESGRYYRTSHVP